jgi:hypothetical protein
LTPGGIKTIKPVLIVAGIIAFVAGACSNDNASLSVTPTPSAVISSAASVANQAVCEAQDQVSQILSQVQAGTITSQADSVVSQVQSTLDQEATTLDSQGNAGLATDVRNLSGALGTLKSAIDSQDATTIATAAGQVVAALSQLPICPSASPSA